MSYIYKIINDVNDKLYIGKTDFSIEKRFREHCNDAFRQRNEKRPLYTAMRKYGIEHFKIELIEKTSNPDEREKYWINFYNTYTKGYNATKGRDGKHLFDHQQIILYIKNNPFATTKEITKHFNCSNSLIFEIMQENNLKLSYYRDISKKVIAFSLKGIFIAEFDSTASAARWLFEMKKISVLRSGVRSHISDVANGKRKTAYGYIWKYID